MGINMKSKLNSILSSPKLTDSYTKEIKIVATSRCDVNCPMCYWSKETRSNSPTLSKETLKQIVQEAKGFDILHLFNGDYPGAVEEIVIPCLEECKSSKINELIFTTSGIFMSMEELELIRNTFHGKICFDISIDGEWGHRNHSKDAENGDVLQKFIDLKSKYPDNIKITAFWTQPENNESALKEMKKFRERCENLGIYFGVGDLVDDVSEKPKFGPVVNPYQLGLDHEMINNLHFGVCTLPCLALNKTTLTVLASNIGAYSLCYNDTKFFQLGEIGEVGKGRLLNEIDRFYQKNSFLTEIIHEKGMLGVMKELLDNPKTKEKAKTLMDRDYPTQSGLCKICSNVQKLYSKLGKSHKKANKVLVTN